uniref:Uncharacterized protein n=2 Tax=Cucumis melo TaxID=3656 RepID=A0A9I9E755_CUCME
MGKSNEKLLNWTEIMAYCHRRYYQTDQTRQRKMIANLSNALKNGTTKIIRLSPGLVTHQFLLSIHSLMLLKMLRSYGTSYLHDLSPSD